MGRSWRPYYVRNVAVFQPCERIDAGASPCSPAIQVVKPSSNMRNGNATTRVSFHRPRKRSRCCGQYRKHCVSKAQHPYHAGDESDAWPSAGRRLDDRRVDWVRAERSSFVAITISSHAMPLSELCCYPSACKRLRKRRRSSGRGLSRRRVRAIGPSKSSSNMVGLLSGIRPFSPPTYDWVTESMYSLASRRAPEEFRFVGYPRGQSLLLEAGDVEQHQVRRPDMNLSQWRQISGGCPYDL